MLLLDIFFESDREVISFCEKLYRQNKKIAVQWRVDEKWGNQISLDSLPLNELNFQSIAEGLVHVYVTNRLGEIIHGIIEENYYFTDRHEIEQIHEFAEWIVIGDDIDSLMIRKSKHPIQLLRAIFLMHIRNATTVHFDSIVQFGMKVFKQDLINYVGLAIDEFKREEEHQSFINTLREYIIKKEPVIPIIHVREDSVFYYYNGQGRQLTRLELRTLMKKEPLYLIGLPEDEWNLAPLIAMAPKEIKMYVDDPSDPKTQTIINVFQERVVLKAVNEFPYSYASER